MAQVNDWLGSSANLSARFDRIIKPKEHKPIEDVTRVTESMMSAFTFVPEEAAKARGLLVETSTTYGLRWDARNSNWIIPIREPLTNKLLGWQEKGHTQRYFNNRPVRVPKSGSLFGYDQYQGGTMIVVESPLDVVRLASVGVTGGVATYGASISTAQFNLIRGADRIIFAMDNDDAGRASSVELLKLCKDMGVESWFFNYDNTDRKDVGGMSRDEIRWGLDNARHMVQGKKAVR
jgi:5S rRNA maturation endonuclease (ribonuclease M5)